MRETIYRKKDNLVIEISWFQKRCNPYDDSEWMGDNIIALIIQQKNCNWSEMGFAYRIDMSYKGKDDQWTDFFYKYNGEQKEFEKLCKELKIDIVYYDKAY